jgi:hypothetical protein
MPYLDRSTLFPRERLRTLAHVPDLILLLRSLVREPQAALKYTKRPRQVIRSSAIIPLPQTFASRFAYSYSKGLMSPKGLL